MCISSAPILMFYGLRLCSVDISAMLPSAVGAFAWTCYQQAILAISSVLTPSPILIRSFRMESSSSVGELDLGVAATGAGRSLEDQRTDTINVQSL